MILWIFWTPLLLLGSGRCTCSCWAVFFTTAKEIFGHFCSPFCLLIYDFSLSLLNLLSLS
ncbi:uncharacterized protein BYT42DRAFT_568262, partial [Radiomyces spectabilis]|uniref:uncharacterized protein n=1 Tax=Radiomyces spectabilis TaxID=64574 RepID=UPI0022203F7B